MRFEPGKFTFSDTELNVLQRVRELEDKLEIQKRHLKELEEKVGGVSSCQPLASSMNRSRGVFSSVSFMKPKEQALSSALSSLPVSPVLAVQEISTFLGKKV